MYSHFFRQYQLKNYCQLSQIGLRKWVQFWVLNFLGDPHFLECKPFWSQKFCPMRAHTSYSPCCFPHHGRGGVFWLGELDILFLIPGDRTCNIWLEISAFTGCLVSQLCFSYLGEIPIRGGQTKYFWQNREGTQNVDC